MHAGTKQLAPNKIEDKLLPKELRRPHPLYPNRRKDQEKALDFVKNLLYCKIPKICLENPVGVISTKIRKPDQIIHPWMFGDEASKSTCLWLKNLPLLKPTKIVGRGEFLVAKSGRRGAKWNWGLPPSKDRSRIRSKTFRGIAEAFATQWGGIL